MTKDEEEKEPIMQKMIRIIVFSMVAFIIVTALVVPIFGTIGGYTVTVSNEGAYVSDIQEKYASTLSGMDSNSAEIVWNTNGIFLSGEVSGTPVSHKIIDKNDFKKGYPLMIAHPRYGYANVIVEYINNAYTVFTSGENTISQNAGSYHILNGDIIYIQDTHGEKILTKDGIYCSDMSNIVGFGYDSANNTFIWSDSTNSVTIVKED